MTEEKKEFSQNLWTPDRKQVYTQANAMKRGDYG